MCLIRHSFVLTEAFTVSFISITKKSFMHAQPRLEYQQQCEHWSRSSDRLTTESLSAAASPGAALTDPLLLILLCSAASLASWCYPAGSHRSGSMVTDWGHSFHSSLTLWDPAAQELPSRSSNSPHTRIHRGLLINCWNQEMWSSNSSAWSSLTTVQILVGVFPLSHIQALVFICFILISGPHLQKQKKVLCKEPDFLKREWGDSIMHVQKGSFVGQSHSVFGVVHPSIWTWSLWPHYLS